MTILESFVDRFSLCPRCVDNSAIFACQYLKTSIKEKQNMGKNIMIAFHHTIQSMGDKPKQLF